MAEEKTLLGAANNNEGAGGAGDGGAGAGGGSDDAAKAAEAKAASDKATADQAAAAKAASDKTALETAKATRDKELTAKLTTEGKTEDEIKAAIEASDKAAAEAAKASQGAPEKYEPFKLPEGLTLNTAASEKFMGVAKELNLSQAQAQKLVDLQAELVLTSSKAQLDAFGQMVKSWKDQTLKDLGPDADKKLTVAAKAKVMFGTPQLVTLLDESGLGNHPEIVKFFIKIGEKISEDKFVTGAGAGAGSDKSIADRLYPTKK